MPSGWVNLIFPKSEPVLVSVGWRIWSYVITALFVVTLGLMVMVSEERNQLKAINKVHIDVCEDKLPRNEFCELTARPIKEY